MGMEIIDTNYVTNIYIPVWKIWATHGRDSGQFLGNFFSCMVCNDNQLSIFNAKNAITTNTCACSKTDIMQI